MGRFLKWDEMDRDELECIRVFINREESHFFPYLAIYYSNKHVAVQWNVTIDWRINVCVNQ